VAQGFEAFAAITIWVKVRAGPSDTLHHAVGEMARRVRGGALAPSISVAGIPCELSDAPLLVAGSSRPPADASGGQEMGPLSSHKPWIQTEGREKDAISGRGTHPLRCAGQAQPRLTAPHTSRLFGMIVAITRPTGAELRECELTHSERVPIDVERACRQHDDYLDVLRSLGVHVVELPGLPDHPDAVFVEDTALVLPEVAVLLRPGAASRRGEVPSMAAALAEYRECHRMEAPATLDGGDIIVFGKKVLVGQTTRSSPAGIDTLTDLLSPFGYTVEAVPVDGVLHLKSAATVVDEETMIVFSSAVDLTGLGARLLEVHPNEPQGANVVRVDDTLLVNASAPRTIAMLATHVDNIVEVHVDEFAKAEGAISCKGVIFEV